MFLESFFDHCWSNEKCLYIEWLAKKGSLDIKVDEWQYANEKENEAEIKGFTNPWCGETYTQKRIVSFRFQRTSHLYIGPPFASVNQTHYYRIEPNDKCVLAMIVKMDGIPYSDAFCIETRWVARRVGNSDLSVQAGIFVDFKKSTLLKKQIRYSTIAEVKPANLDLFREMQKVFEKDIQGGVDPIEDEEIKNEEIVAEHLDITLTERIQKTLLSHIFHIDYLAYFLFGFLVLGCWFFLRFYYFNKNDFENNDVLYDLTKKINLMEEEIHAIRIITERVLRILEEDKQCEMQKNNFFNNYN